MALLCGCVYFAKHTPEGACASSLDSPIRNFCVVAPGVLWRGERPTRGDAEWLLQHGVGTVVNLEVFLDDHHGFDAAVVPAGSNRSVDYFHLPDFEPLHIVNWSLLDRHVAKFLAILSEAPKPVYIHCLDGVDRTGALTAAYRVLMEGVSREQAIAEMANFRSPYLRFDARYIRSLEGERRAAIMRNVAAWKSRLKPDARVTCERGKCSYSSLN